MLSALGIAEQFGYRRHNAHLDDVVRRQERAGLSSMAWLPGRPSRTTRRADVEQKLSTRVPDLVHRERAQGEPFRFHDYPVNQLAGVQSQTPDFLINVHRIGDVRGAEDYSVAAREDRSQVRPGAGRARGTGAERRTARRAS
jgi:hypothetical protein